MLDIKFIRENPDKAKQGCEKKQVKIDIDRLLAIDKKKNEYLKEIEGLRSKQNKLGKDNIKEAQEIKAKIKKREPELEKTKKEFQGLMLQIPNLPFDDVPLGEDEKNNLVLEEIGAKPKFNFKIKDYLELAENLDLIDTKRAAKAAGSRFYYLKGKAPLIEFALINFVFNRLNKKGFIPIIPPVMLKSEMAKGMGYLEQADENEAYFLPKDEFYLVGTSEQSIGVMHADEVFEEKDLPKRYVGFSTCFRREAGAHGKDTKGIFRVHQFDKIEMFVFCKPEDSKKEHKLLLEIEKELMNDLRLPYRVVHLCTGDMGRPSASTYDIETWMPGQNQYRETHSTSNCTDFQSRRLNIRYRDLKTKKLNFVHMLNGTALAIPRTLIAIIENYQQKDGSIAVPKALQEYTKFLKIS